MQTEQDCDTLAIEVASVRNYLPTLWQVLLGNAPVPARRADDGALVLLHADGRVEPAPLQAGTFEA